MHRTIRICCAGACVLGTLMLPAWPAPAVAATTGGTACEFQAVIQFDSPYLTAIPAPFTSNIVGGLSQSVPGLAACSSTVGGAPAGTPVMDAGDAYSVTVSGTDPITGDWSVTYALPESAGYGSCALSTSSGTLIADWPDGTHTVVDYSTIGAGPVWLFGGQVAAAATLNQVASTGTPPAGTPSTYTVSSDNAAFPTQTQVGGATSFISEIGDPTCSATTFGGAEGSLEFSTNGS